MGGGLSDGVAGGRRHVVMCRSFRWGRRRVTSSGPTSRFFFRCRRCRTRGRELLGAVGRQLDGRRLRGRLRGRIALGRRQGPNLVDSCQRHAHDITLLLRGRSPARSRAIFNTALLQHVGQNNFVLADFLDGPLETVERTLRRQRRHDHLDFAITARPEFRDLDRFEQRPRFRPVPRGLCTTTPSSRQEQTGCQTEDGLQRSTTRGKHGLRKIP